MQVDVMRWICAFHSRTVPRDPTSFGCGIMVVMVMPFGHHIYHNNNDHGHMCSHGIWHTYMAYCNNMFVMFPFASFFRAQSNGKGIKSI